MPYIDKASREFLDDPIDRLIAEIKYALKYSTSPHPAAFAGMLNYVCTRIAMGLMPELRYWSIALVSGVFSNMASEFYRRVGEPYEDKAIEKNGDLREFTKEIK